MRWHASFALGIEEIDAQHRELLSIFGHIVELLEQGARWADLHFKLVELRRFTEFHFEFEEALMRLFGYDHAEEHAIAHQDFFHHLDALERRSLTAAVEEETIRFLASWLKEHILGVDRHYAQHIRSGAKVKMSAPPDPAAA